MKYIYSDNHTSYKLDDFEVIERLGAGKFGMVDKVLHKQNN
jgi:hypothetical protein